MIRSLAVLLSLLTALIVALPAAAQSEDFTLEEEFLLQEISDHNTAVRSMAGRFTQIGPQGGRTEGTFFAVRPNKIRFRYAPPSREEIISTGSGFYVINREERTQYAYAQDQVPLRQFLGDEVDLVDNANVTDMVISDTHVSVMLADQSPVGTVEVSLIFDKQSLDLVQWSLIEPSGAETTFSITEMEKNVEIPDSYFRIDPTYRSVQAPQ